jgi:hypothetical protein
MQQDDLRKDLKTGSKEFLFSFPAIFCIYLEHRKYGLCHLPYPFLLWWNNLWTLLLCVDHAGMDPDLAKWEVKS